MKKRSLAIILALVLVMAFGTSAFAAQAISGAGFGGFNAYQATPTYTQVYNANPAVGAIVYSTNTFNPDGKSNYPYEIYLPNESHPDQYRIHTNYTKNTDACASCHATHTAVGASLLQWYSTFETCMACHDGTVTTTYNVEDGKIGYNGASTFGGAFGNGSEHYASQHNVQGSVTISAAPGGSVVGKEVNTGKKTISMWTTSFGCESCHTPHGQGGNARILNPDPNGYATLNNKKSYTIEAVTGGVYDADGNHVTLIKGYPYVTAINGSTVESASYKIDNTAGYSVVKTLDASALPVGITSVTGTASVKVTMNIEHYLGLDNVAEAVYHTSGINTFCGTCHTDYNTETQANVNRDALDPTKAAIMGDAANRPGYGALTGEYSKAHRHSVGLPFNYGDAADTTLIGDNKLMKTMNGNISCLTCHYAHGTSQEFWATSIGTLSDSYFVPDDKRTEIAGSSALKRLPNMGTCEACHQKADANQGYAANSTATGTLAISNAPDMNEYAANAAHEAYFAGNTYKDATTCLICHATAGDDFMKSVHWNTDGPSNVNKDFFGGLMAVKDYDPANPNPWLQGIFNDANGFTKGMPFGMSDRFCGFPGGAAGVSFAYSFTADGGTQEGNSCGKCHASIGMNMPPLFTGFMAKGQGLLQGLTLAQISAKVRQDNTAKIDCLACHLDRKDYDTMVNKIVVGNPGQTSFTYGNTKHSVAGINPTLSNADFKVAEVGKAYKLQLPNNENCMTCHEHAMAGPVYKRHALYSKGTDIHAAENMECVDCHVTSKHLIAKGIQATDLVANDRPEVEVSCIASKCHTATPHDATKHRLAADGQPDQTLHEQKIAELNKHTAKLACQACHVKTEVDSYANAAMAYVNNSQAERGYNYRFGPAGGHSVNENMLFKGGAIFNDFRSFNASASMHEDVTGAAYGYLGSIPEAGRSEWMMVQPGNFAWRWFNGTGTGMANAVASFGFYDAYYFNDGFSGFRGTNQLPAPYGFGSDPTQYGTPLAATNFIAKAMMGGNPAADFSTANGLKGLFGGYWSSYNDANMFKYDLNGNDHNSFDNELYAGAPKGGSGDKIYPFRKMQAWMPVPRTNFWFLTPHDMKTVKDSSTLDTEVNYLALKNAIESPMMYMFFSEMFKPAMELYAQEFGFQYMYVERDITTVPGKTPDMYYGLLQGMGAMAGGVDKLNGLIYAADAQWLDAPAGNTTTGTGIMVDVASVPTELMAPETAADGQNMLQAGQLATYMYFPMPVDANIMEDHAIAAKDFKTTEGAYYEPRTCNECHTTPNATTFDNKDWNPLVNPVETDGLAWGSNFKGTVNTDANAVGADETSVIDWSALGYSAAEIGSYTGAGNWTTLNDK